MLYVIVKSVEDFIALDIFFYNGIQIKSVVNLVKILITENFTWYMRQVIILSGLKYNLYNKRGH